MSDINISSKKNSKKIDLYTYSFHKWLCVKEILIKIIKQYLNIWKF